MNHQNCPIKPIGQILIIDSNFDELAHINFRRKDNKEIGFSKVLNDNLLMIDVGMPIILKNIIDMVSRHGGESSRNVYLHLIELNPLHIDKDWIENTYRFKIAHLLYDLTLGVNEEVVWNGRIPIGGILYSKGRKVKELVIKIETH